MSHIKAEMSCLESSVGTMKNRCEELATESTKLQEEKRKLAESLAVAQRESAEAANKLAAIRESGGVGTSGFTAEQLEKQAKVLKSRLTCPVCNVRDKQVILLRCRHMFCRNCVDENVKVSFTRPAPAAGAAVVVFYSFAHSIRVSLYRIEAANALRVLIASTPKMFPTCGYKNESVI